MRLVRFRQGSGIAAGSLEAGFVRPIRGTFFEDPVPTGQEIPLDEVRLLAPVIPSKVVAVGKNYAEHAAEMGGEVPEEPVIFLKPSTTVVGPDDPVPCPDVGRVDHEAELAVVVGRLARRVPIEEAGRYVLGYTCANDVTARDLQRRDGQWTRGKSFDGFCPLGPWVETEFDASDAAIECRVNGDTRQAARTSQLVVGPGELLSFVSAVMTLLPGDVLLTGTPAGVGPLTPGDRVEVEVEGIGVLANPVVADD
ncbi:MAG TPA: fumarylacetoacetate hydrolase family protein [Actinomycetota bacterium]|jgi:2-keto-4-pentenoate hydratase/2-oxohepta-3-ene-1,7-dioic acid hydratase in catechol pathway